MKLEASIAFDNIPLLIKINGSVTMGKMKQAVELLRTFFLPLLAIIEDEDRRGYRDSIEMLYLTIEEVEYRLFAAKL